MSGGLVRLIRSAFGTKQEEAAAPASPGATVDQRPPLIRHIEQLLTERYGAQCPKIYRYRMTSQLSLHQSQDGTLKPSYTNQFWWSEREHRELFEDDGEPQQLPLVLHIERVAYETTRMPIDVQIEFCGLRPQFVIGTREQSLDRTRAPLRDDILLANQPLMRDRNTLLSSALLYSEPVTGAHFCSVEAIGFHASSFFAMLQRVPESMANRIQRLFWSRHEALSPGNSTKSLHHSTGVGAFYMVPLSNRYTPLVRNVHTYLAVQQACLDPGFHFDTVDSALFDLPCTSTAVIFEHADLHRAVDFIEDRLLGTHPRIHPNHTGLVMEPAAHVDWPSVILEREYRPDVDAGGYLGLVCTVQLVVYYVFVDRAEEQPPLARSHSDIDDVASSYDECDSVEFVTPRTAAAGTPRVPATGTPRTSVQGAPRLPTAQEFVAANELSETVPDPQALVQSPLRLMMSPRSLFSTPRRVIVPPSGPSVLSDDMSASDNSGSTTPGESTELRYKQARLILDSLNAKLGRVAVTARSTEESPS